MRPSRRADVRANAGYGGVVIALIGSLASCAASPALVDPLVGGDAGRQHLAVETFPAAAARQLHLAAETRVVLDAFRSLEARGGWRERGYFDAAESDAAEALLLRFTVLHSALWGEIDRWGGAQLDSQRDAAEPRAHTLLAHAGWALADSGSMLVAEFADDPVAIAKLNEAFYRSEIPARTYERLALAFTSAERDDELAAAWRLHERILSDDSSPLVELRDTDAVAAELLEETAALHRSAAGRIASLRAHSTAEKLDEAARHTAAARLDRATKAELGGTAYTMRSLLFKDVSRIKKPGVHVIRFSDAQKRALHEKLQPGDILLTYTAGYVSDVFIPGVFKHAITFVGTPAQREPLGDLADRLPAFADPELDRFARNVAVDVLPDGKTANLVEAVAEGVKLSNLDHILDTHVNRLVVLRPVLSGVERAEFVAGVFALLGDPYDFRFDFADASRQVCTEVIYRALGTRGGTQFTLTERGGHATLSADDIVRYQLAAARTHFEVLIYAEEDADRDGHRARLWTGEDAATLVATRMTDPGR